MLLYLSLTLGKCNCVEARPLIAIGSLLSTICAIIMGFGLGSAVGMEFNAIILLIPLIILGVGVDDDIIIVESLNRTQLPKNNLDNAHERFGIALKRAGLSITLTSFSTIVAFGVGSFVDLPAVQAFCVFACFTFLSNYGACAPSLFPFLNFLSFSVLLFAVLVFFTAPTVLFFVLFFFLD